METYDIYGIGAALVDTEIVTNDDFLAATEIEKGLMTLVDHDRQQAIIAKLADFDAEVSQASGGSACNSMVAAAYFGSRCFFSGRVAADEPGAFFINDLNAANVAFKAQTPPSGNTGKCLVLVTPDAERTMNTFLGANDELEESDIDYDAIAASNYLYIEGYLVTSDNRLQVALTAIEHARKHGVKIAVSFADPAMVHYFGEQLKTIVGDGVDLIFCNEEEALGFTGTDSIDAASESLKQYCQQFAITRGAKGARVWDGEQQSDCSGVTATAIDTNGAGDMFAGAFMHAIQTGHAFPAAAEFANTAAAQVVQKYGPRLAPSAHQALLAQLNA